VRVLIDSGNQKEESSFLDFIASRCKIWVIFSDHDVSSTACFTVHLKYALSSTSSMLKYERDLYFFQIIFKIWK
jgi:hypothetical protein